MCIGGAAAISKHENIVSIEILSLDTLYSPYNVYGALIDDAKLLSTSVLIYVVI